MNAGIEIIGLPPTTSGQSTEVHDVKAKPVAVPVSGDLENGYGADPETVAETIRRSIAQGMVGGSIEDSTAEPDEPLYDIGLAVEILATINKNRFDDLRGAGGNDAYRRVADDDRLIVCG